MAVVTETFPDFASALAACGPGYDNAVLADVIAYKTALAVDPRYFAPEQAVNSILSVGIAAAEIIERPLTVLDFGGGCGFHYFRVTAAMQLISSNDRPGTPATDTVVRAGPPRGKYVLNTRFMPS